MSAREILITVLIVSLGLAGTAWFLANFEQVTEPQKVGFRGEAKRNPWLAAQRLLERSQTTASELREFNELRALQKNAILFLPARRQAIPEPYRNHIIDWVRNGGFLIIEAENVPIADPMLSAFGVERIADVEDEDDHDDDFEIVDDKYVGEENSDAENYPEERNRLEKNSLNLSVVQFPGSSLTSLVWMAADFSLIAERAWFRAGTEHAANMLLLQEGNGTVAAVNDFGFARNAKIGELNHAQFLLELVRIAQRSGPVVFFHNPTKPSLMKWLHDHAWAPICAAALALLLWLWKVIPRFGPISPDPERARRRLLDHLRASGRFLWASGEGGRLLEVSREAALRRTSRALPDFETATEAAKRAQLSRVFGLSSDQAERLLAPQMPGKMTHFMHTIHLYQTIHARLAMRKSNRNERRQ